MQVEEIKIEGLRREFKVAVDATEIEDKINYRLTEYAKTVKMPGFRPGKVPVSLLRKRFGDSVRGEILEQAVNDTSNQTITERGLRPAHQPKIEVTSFDEGGDLEYTMEFDVIPEIEPCDFSKISLERLVVAVDEKEIDEALDRLADMHKSSEPITGNRKSKKGDVTVIDFVGKVGGEEFAGGSAEDYHLELGSGSFIPGFEEQVIGSKAGDKIEVNVKFPDEYGAEDLAGKDAVFDVTVKELRESTPAEIDDELAKKFGKENLKELREAIEEERQREFHEVARMRLKRALLDELSNAHEFEIPETLANEEFEAIWQQYEQQRDAGELDDDDKAKSDDEHKADFKEISERRVRLGLLLSEVGRLNDIQIGQDEINQRLFQEAQRYQGQEQQVLEFYRSNPQAMQSLTAPLYEDKVVDFILELTKIEDRTVSLEELLAEPEETKKKPAKKAAAKKAPAKKTAAKKPAAKKKAPTKKDESE